MTYIFFSIAGDNLFQCGNIDYWLYCAEEKTMVWFPQNNITKGDSSPDFYL